MGTGTPTRSRYEIVLGMAIVALAYALTAWAGLLVSYPASPVFPAAGIAVAAILLWGRSMWVGIWIGSLVANMLGYPNHQDLWNACVASAGIAMGSTLQALLSAYLIRRFSSSANPLATVRGASVLLGLGAGASCVVASTIGTTVLVLLGTLPRPTWGWSWTTWWLGDVAGILTVTPLVLAWKYRRRIDVSVARALEAAVLVLLVLLVGVLTFGRSAFPIEHMLVPLLVLAAFRFGTLGATTTIALTSVLAVVGTARGQGPFAVGDTVRSLFLLEAFLASGIVTTVLLSAVLEERRELALRKSLSDAQLQHSQRMESLSLLAGGIAHDFNNLLQGVFGFMSLAASSLDDPKAAADYLAHATSVFDRAKALTNQSSGAGRRSYILGRDPGSHDPRGIGRAGHAGTIARDRPERTRHRRERLQR